MVDYRSVSQYREFVKCSWAFKLHRIDRVWERPAAWLVQGLAVHEAAEAWERSGRTMSIEETQAVFSESFDKHATRLGEKAPDFKTWFRSGPYDAVTDLPRRFDIGLEQTAKYIEYYCRNDEEKIWVTPDGEPAIELEFDVEIGQVRVKGYIDQVIELEDGTLVVRDIKTGNQPGDDFQLAVYATALWLKYGVKIVIGDYWMGRTGKPTKDLYKLDFWSLEKVAERFEAVDQAIRSENFVPNPSEDNCRFCSVAGACEFSFR